MDEIWFVTMSPDILLYYWHGGEIPTWRMENHERLVKIYPDAKVIKDTGLIYSEPLSCAWRIKMCSSFNRCLWIDNDIELDGPLDLTEKPALADEYCVGHVSICWSGNHPEVFAGLEKADNYNNFLLQQRVWAGLIDKIKINGTHWAMTANGEKGNR